MIQSSAGEILVFADLATAVAAIEGNSSYDVDSGEVFLFRAGSDSYLGLATAQQDIGPVIKLVGVGAKSSVKLVEGSTDGMFYVVPTGG